MGSCCAPEEKKETTFSGAENGPAQNRGCTDVWCLGVFAAHWVVFLIVSFAGAANGNPSKLYMPRDFMGAYCDAASNWNNGPNTAGFPMLSYMMNVSSTTDEIAKQMVCSTMSKSALVGTGLMTAEEEAEYLCACCLSPCAKCEGSLNNGGDLTTSSGLSSTITGRMSGLTGGSLESLMSPSGLNGDMFSNMWAEATKYFVEVCVQDCTTDHDALTALGNSSSLRSYTYSPDMDSDLSRAWTILRTENITGISSTLTSSFTFSALPMTMCPYEDASRCVPMPGLKFAELVAGSGYCTFEMAAEATAVVGSAASAALAGTGASSFSAATTDGLGQWMGHVVTTIDSAIIVAVLSFVIALIFLVLLRFTVGACVWFAVFLTCLIFPISGAIVFVRSGQCVGAGIFETGTQVAVAVTVAGTTSLTNAVTGQTGVSEALTGDGTDYRGAQQYTNNGYACKKWSETTTGNYYNNSEATYPTEMLLPADNNFCRNPYNTSDLIKARTIWCFTTDPEVTWELCTPIGVIQPECAHGYAVEGQTMRDVMWWCAIVLWALSGVWLIVVFCFVSRIRLAIKLNQVGAQFLGQNPTVVLVPIVQALVGIVWLLIWFFLASFLLSQVPDGYVPTQAYATYAEAYGVDGSGFLESGTPGACTDSWPTGGVWKDTSCETNSTAGTAACWRCYPPRYVFDVRFAYSFFSFLWNNCFNVALGQCIIAGAVCAWFFSPSKGSDPILRQSVTTTFRYHLGSIALGSFIIALIMFIRYVMKYLEKQAQAQKNKVMVLVFKIIGTCIWCFEQCVKFLNKNAYIQIALMGTNFCTSAKKAFFLILRNALRFGTVAVLGQVVQSIGVFCITAGTAILGYFIVKGMHDDVPPFFPLLVFIGIGYVVAKLHMSVFGMSVDTCLQCFIAVEEMGGNENTPEILQSILPQVEEDAKKEGCAEKPPKDYDGDQGEGGSS